MKVDQAAYRTWGGELRPGARSVLAIAATDIRRVLARTWIRILLLVIVLIALIQATILSYMVYQPVMGDLTLGDLAEQQGLGRIDPFVIALRGFLGMISFFAPVVVAPNPTVSGPTRVRPVR